MEKFSKYKLKNKFSYTILLILICAALFKFAYPYIDGTGELERGILTFHAIDAGQGDSFLFTFPEGSTMLVDAGTEESGAKIVRYLKKTGVKKIDVLAAPHPHSDHIGGMQEVMDNFPIGKVWDSGYNHGSKLQINFYKRIKAENIPFGRPKRGFTENIDGAEVEFIAPLSGQKGIGSDANNNSLVFLVTYGNVSFLMTGDMEKDERRSIKNFPKCTVLKAPHHGSSNGTDRLFLAQTRPEAVVISYERGNSYGHPHKEVVRAIKKAGIRRFDTADGSLCLRTDGRNLTFPKERQID